jgi:hypothetical protein
MSYTVSMISGSDDANRVAKIQAIYERLKEQWSDFRAQSLKAFEYVSGIQLDPQVREELRRENRPAMIFNLMQPKLVTIAGLLESNKMFMRAVPINEGDEQLADMHTQLVSDWGMRNCGGMKEITKAAIDAAIGKIGWLNNYWSTQDNIEGKWITESYDPFMLLIDADARKQDQSDWRYMAATGFYTADEIISIFADSLDEETIQMLKENDERISGLVKKNMPTSWIERVWSGVNDFFSRTISRKGTNYESGMINDYVDSRAGRYRVIEFHDRRTRVRTLFYNTQTRETQEMPEGTSAPADSVSRASDFLQQLNITTGGGWISKTVVTHEVWRTACAPYLMPNKVLMEAPYAVQGRGFQFKPIFCYNFHPDITKMQSLMDVLIEPQDSYNQRRMTFLEWLMRAVNPDWAVPHNSIDEKDLETWKSKERGKLLFFKTVNAQTPTPVHPLAEASSLKVFSEEDRDLAETLTNITPNTQGTSENKNESGVLFAQKVQRALTALSYFFGNVQLSMKEVFKYTDASLQQFMTAPRKVRLLNKSNQPYWLQLNMPTLQGVLNDVSQGEFDFEPDTLQLGETAKQVKFAEAMEFVRAVPAELIKWDELFKLWDSPVADVMGQFAAQMMGIMQQAQQAQAQQAQDQAAIQQMTGAAGAVQAVETAAQGPAPLAQSELQGAA